MFRQEVSSTVGMAIGTVVTCGLFGAAIFVIWLLALIARRTDDALSP